MLANLARITYLELVFSLRIPASVMYVFLLPTLLLLLFGNRYSNLGLLVTGLSALVAGVSTLQGVGQVTATMRHGIWKTIRVSVHPDWLYLAGVIASRMLRTLLVAVILLFSAWVAFDYRLGGSVAVHFGLVVLGSVPFACLGLFLAYLPSSPMTASMIMNVCILAMLAVSGIFFEPSGTLRALSYVSPLTFLTDLLRANSDGTVWDLRSVLGSVAALGAWAVAAAFGAYKLAHAREDD